ncbi:hypothetical protein Bca52824_048732 [Brassica carinata]|uniref:Pectate lyase domain-containing protein n=1 Tax=Brassica carinata TaxID=52824 RepID=A0A8X7RLF9_BRACI|nr:hypothetical protein Bca52824_048732 [Brassica carinata]
MMTPQEEIRKTFGVLRGDRLRKRRPSDPQARNVNTRCGSRRAALDHLPTRHDHSSQRITHHELFQDQRRSWRVRAHRWGPCITIQYMRSSPRHYRWRTISDGDGVSIFGGNHVWVDHCSLSNCEDWLIDAIMGSTAITLSNNYMMHHDKVMLLGHSDT